MRFRYKYSILIGLTILTFSACVTQKYERPQVKNDGLYRDNNTTDTVTMANLPWKNLFSDNAGL